MALLKERLAERSIGDLQVAISVQIGRVCNDRALLGQVHQQREEKCLQVQREVEEAQRRRDAER